MLPSVWYLLISVGVHQLTGPGPNRAELFQYWQSSFLLLLGNSGLQVCTAHLRVTLPGSHHPEVWKSKGSGLRPGEGSEALTPEEPNTQQSRQMRLNARFLKIKINAKEKKKNPPRRNRIPAFQIKTGSLLLIFSVGPRLQYVSAQHRAGVGHSSFWVGLRDF